MGKIADRFSAGTWQTSSIVRVYVNADAEPTMLLRTRCACSVKKETSPSSSLLPLETCCTFFYTLPLNLVILVKCHSSITFDFWDWKKFGGREEGNKHNSHSVYLTLKPLPDSALSVSPNLESSLQGRTLLNSMSQNTVELAHLSSPLCTAVGRVYAQYSLFAPGMYWSSRRHAVLEIAPTGTESCRRDKYLAGAEWKTAGCYVSLVTTPHPYSLSLCLCLSTSPNSEQDDLSEKQTLTFAHQGLWFTHCWSGSVLWNSGSALKYRVSAINQKE